MVELNDVVKRLLPELSSARFHPPEVLDVPDGSTARTVGPERRPPADL